MAIENSSGLNTGALVGAVAVGLILVVGLFLSLGGDNSPEAFPLEPVSVEASDSADTDTDTDVSVVEAPVESALENVSPTAQ